MNRISENVQEQINAMIRGDQKGLNQGSTVMSACVFNGEVHINVYLTPEKEPKPQPNDERK